MVLDNEKSGYLKPGDRIVESTAGNTGISLLLASIARGYNATITMPEKMSREKADILTGLGATLLKTPTVTCDDPRTDPRSNFSVARRLRDEEGYKLMNQFQNPSNPIAHYDQLAEEILYQCDDKVDAIVVGPGTGGTLTGVSRKIKEKSPNTLIVSADLLTSTIAMPQTLNEGKHPPSKIEGIGFRFVPRTCSRDLVDQWIKVGDPESFKYARDLIQKEGLLVGGSSGSIMAAALKFIKEKGWAEDNTKRVVCIFPDSIRNYLTNFLSKEWCVKSGLLPYEELNEEDCIFNEIPLSEMNLPDIESYEDLTIGEAKEIFEKGAKIIPLRSNGEINGVIIPQKFVQFINLKKLKLADSAVETKWNDFVIVPHTLTVTQLEKYLFRYLRLLEKYEIILVSTRNADNKIQRLQVATIKDTLKFLK